MAERMEVEEKDHKTVIRNILQVLENVKENMNIMIREMENIKRRPKKTF